MGAHNPLGLAAWYLNAGDGGDDAGDWVELGKINHVGGGEGELATIFQNVADRNAALIAENGGEYGGVGVAGQSYATEAGVGVLGGCDLGWGVAGVATSVPLQIAESVDSPVRAAGVVGIGDGVGVYGESRPALGQTIPDVVSAPPAGTGVYGIGEVVGIHGDGDGPDGRGGVLFSGEIAQLQLTPVVTDGIPPATGAWGDIWATVSRDGNDQLTPAIYLCTKPSDGAAPARWSPFTLGPEIAGK